MTDITKNRQALQFLKKPKAIIFDWDNTLVDTWPLIRTAINITMTEMGKPQWSLDEVRDNVHKSMRDYFPDIFGDQWQKAGEVYRNAYKSIDVSEIKLLPYSLELIKTIHDLKILQFVISNKAGATLRKEVKKLAVEKYFFSVIGAFDANFDKPNKSAVDLALSLSELDLKNDCIWFVGDTISDIECAYNSGCLPIVFGHSSHKISQSISDEILENGFGYSKIISQEIPKLIPQIIPVYFDHQELTLVIKSFFEKK